MKPVVAISLKNSFGQMAVYALIANAHIHPEELYPQSPILQDIFIEYGEKWPQRGSAVSQSIGFRCQVSVLSTSTP
jgi:hypothetical protein